MYCATGFPLPDATFIEDKQEQRAAESQESRYGYSSPENWAQQTAPGAAPRRTEEEEEEDDKELLLLQQIASFVIIP